MCFTVVVGRQATVDGSVIVGHNEENHGPYFVNFRRVHQRQLSKAAFAERRLTWPKEIRLPRYGFLWSQIPGREYSDTYLNDAGLLIVSNGCPSREDDLETLIHRQEIFQEGIGGLLRRLVAEQAGSAQEAVDLIGRLVEQFGYRDSGRTYVVADPQEAWVVAVVRGRRWLAHRVPEDAAVVVPNVFIFDQIPWDPLASNPSENPSCQIHQPLRRHSGEADAAGSAPSASEVRCSADLRSYAIQRGWYDPASGKPFSFREAYQAAERNRPDLRQWWGQQLLQNPFGLKRDSWPGVQQPAAPAAAPNPNQTPRAEPFAHPTEPLPWYVRPGRKLSAADLAAILRNQQGPVSLFHPATQEMAIVQLRPGLPRPIGCVYWRTVGRPDSSPLLPWYLGVEEVPAEYCHPAFREQLESWNPAEPVAPEIFQPDSALIWWKFHALRQMADRLPDQIRQKIWAIWAAREQQLWSLQAELENELLTLWSANPADCRRRMTTYCIDQSEAICQQVNALLHQWSQEATPIASAGQSGIPSQRP